MGHKVMHGAHGGVCALAQGCLLGMQSFIMLPAHFRGRGDAAPPARWGLCLCCWLLAGPPGGTAGMMGWHVLLVMPLAWLASLSSIKTYSVLDLCAGRHGFAFDLNRELPLSWHRQGQDEQALLILLHECQTCLHLYQHLMQG